MKDSGAFGMLKVTHLGSSWVGEWKEDWHPSCELPEVAEWAVHPLDIRMLTRRVFWVSELSKNRNNLKSEDHLARATRQTPKNHYKWWLSQPYGVAIISSLPGDVLFSMVAISNMQLLKCKLITIKSSLASSALQLHWLHCECLIASWC